MDVLDELENMASNALTFKDDFEPNEQEVHRWHHLFGYSYSECVEKIKNHKSDYTRKTVSNEYWNAIKSEKESQGYSRDAYEHLFTLGHTQLITTVRTISVHPRFPRNVSHFQPAKTSS